MATATTMTFDLPHHLPHGFRVIRLELARETGHPEGSRDYGYTLVAPLEPDGHIDAEAWKQHRAACRVARFRPGEDLAVGHLVHRPGGSWAFRYDVHGDEDDEAGYRFSDERFVVGEYVSIHEDDGLHPFVVTSVESA